MTTIGCRIYGPDSPETGFDVLASEWNGLLHRSRFNSFFLTHEWQTIWWRNLGEGDLWIVAFYDDGGDGEDCNDGDAGIGSNAPTLVGIAPLYCFTPSRGTNAGKNVLTLVGCTEISDYLDLIIAEGWEDHVYQSFAQWLRSDDAPAWHRLDLCNLPEDSLTYRNLPTLLEEQPLAQTQSVDITQEDVAPYFELPSTYEEYLQTQVDKKQRHEMRRKQRRIEREAHCEFYIVGEEKLLERSGSAGIVPKADFDCQGFEREMDDFLRLQMASREDKAEFMTDEMASFFRTMACFMQQAGYLRLFFLRVDGIQAATLMAFEYDGRLWLYNSGYDPDVFGVLSPGWVILSYSIQYAITAGLKVYDFMQGDEAYKYRYGGQDYKVMRVTIER